MLPLTFTEVTFIKEILNGKFHFLCSGNCEKLLLDPKTDSNKLWNLE